MFRIAFLSLLIAACLLPDGAFAQAGTGLPPRLTQPRDGDSKVAGYARSALADVQLTIYTDTGNLVKQCKGKAKEEDDWAFTVDLVKECSIDPLKQGYIVIAASVGKDGKPLASSRPMGVAAKAALATPAPAAATATAATAPASVNECDATALRADNMNLPGLPALRGGLSALKGDTVLPSGLVYVCVNSARVTIADSSAESPAFKTDAIPFKGAKFSLKFEKPLATKSKVLVVITSTDQTPEKIVRMTAAGTVQAGKDDCDPESSDTLEVKAAAGNALAGVLDISGAYVLACMNGKPLNAAPRPANGAVPTYQTTSLQLQGNQYDVVLQSPLRANQHLVLIATASDFSRRISGSTDVQSTIVPAIRTAAPALQVGQTSIPVTATPTPAGATWEVHVASCDPSIALKTSDNKAYVVTDAAGFANLPLAQPLFEDEKISVCQTVVDKSTGTPLKLGTGSKFTTVTGPLTKDKRATVATDPATRGSGDVVRVFPCDPTYALAGNKLFETADAGGSASLTFLQDIVSGHSIDICRNAVDATGNLVSVAGMPISASTILATPNISVSDPGDLGKFRFYFTTGVVLSSADNFQAPSGTQAGLFLGLNADRSWLSGHDFGIGSKWKDQSIGWRLFNIGTFLDARMTSVATQGTQGNTPSSSTTTTNTTSPLQSFVSSSKAATLHAGVYVPFSIRPFEAGSKHELYSLFLGPLAKTGFTTLTDSQTASAVGGRFFTDYSYGGRLGVFHNRRNRDSAPEIVSFLDITVGRFGGFEAWRDVRKDPNNANFPFEQPVLHTVRPWRYQFEGQIKLPHTPFLVGFNANIGRGSIPADVNAKGTTSPAIFPLTQPRDDLRFLFGAQFDFSKFIKLLPLAQ